MDHLKPLNRKAKLLVDQSKRQDSQDQGQPDGDVHAMQQLPLGCTLAFGPGWEAGENGLVTGLCHPMEADLYGCYDNCSWPAQVPDQITNFLDWKQKDGTAGNDWRKLDLIFPEDKDK
jgi:Quinohemoprotein amine dehydrogenase, gamma subunit